MAAKQSQKAFLTAVKQKLSKLDGRDLKWDEIAGMAGIEPRALKTYRVPESSADYRAMPPVVEAAIKGLLERRSNPAPAHEEAGTPDSLLVPALAALVMRQASGSLIEGRMIAGVSRSFNSPVGLTSEDRRAMALVSRACLTNGLSDTAAEIHQLLWSCTQPLGEWLSVPEVTGNGLASTRLIHEEEGIPTAEAEELASGFGGLTAGLEEQLFTKFMEMIGRYPPELAEAYYTKVREFVVRHPISNGEEIRKLGNDLPSNVWMVIQQQFYEGVPESWAFGQDVRLCDHCGNAMKPGKAGWVCRTNACTAAKPSQSTRTVPSAGLLRVARGIRQYWVEPGIDEIILYDALVGLGLPAILYPNRDRVDIGVGKTGIDLKTYASPEILGAKFKRSLGGLAHYATKWVVVPDWQVVTTPSYLDRLRTAMERSDVRCLSVSKAIEHFRKELVRA
jgi:hypothetical protein